jgi:hypothetical protein
VGLLRHPTLGASTEDLGKPHSHFGRNPAPAIHEFRQSSARDSESGSGIFDGQTQGFDALAQHKAAWVRWILHRYGSIFLNDNQYNQRPPPRRFGIEK